MTVTVPVDSEYVMNLIIPSPTNNCVDRKRVPNTLRAVLVEVSTDTKLAASPGCEPRATLERELTAQTGREVNLGPNVELRLTVAGPGQLVIYLPSKAPHNIPWSPTDESLYGKNSMSPLAASTDYNSSPHTQDHCATVNTNCQNAYISVTCPTQGYEWRRSSCEEGATSWAFQAGLGYGRVPDEEIMSSVSEPLTGLPLLHTRCGAECRPLNDTLG